MKCNPSKCKELVFRKKSHTRCAHWHDISLRSSRFLSFFRRRGDWTSERKAGERRSTPGVSQKIGESCHFSQFSSRSRAFGKGKETAASQANMISNIPQCSELTVLGLSFQQDCRFDKHVKGKLGKANKCLYVIRSLRKEGCNQFEVDYLFKTIVLPNVTYALVVYGASGPELTTVQDFLDRCYKRPYISARLNIRTLLEKQDRKLFSEYKPPT